MACIAINYSRFLGWAYGVLVSDKMREIAEMNEKFTEFFKKYESFMYSIANSVLKDRDKAEDAVQTASIKIYKNFQRIGDIESLRTKYFVLIVTKKAAIDLCHRQKKESGRKAFYKK